MGEEVKEKKPNGFVTGFNGFCRFVYNPDDKTVMGRGGASWAKITVFYIFFYAFLAGFFTVCLTVMLGTLDDNKPTVTGRTNKPVLAIQDKALYSMNFKSNSAWQSYKSAARSLKKSYNSNNANSDWFQWDTTTLGPCGGDDSSFAVNTEEVRKGCFFFGLNRMYDWVPFAADSNKKLAYKCKWDIGLAGDGNIDPPIEMTMYPTFEDQALEKYYPWRSMSEHGKQALAAVHLEVNVTAALETPSYKTPTYLSCYAYIRDLATGDESLIKDSSPAKFFISYPNTA